MLDAGAGSGFFLDIAKQRGWNDYGTEIIDKTVNNCQAKGLTMFKGDLQNIDFGDLVFDVIISIEVLELIIH